LLAVGIQFFDHAIDRFHLFVHSGMTQIDNMNEQIGFAYFFERGLERLDQCVGKFSQEPHCIGEKDALFVRQNEAARGRIKRREKFVLSYDICAGEQIQ
jgi:hypothetical protein